MRHLLAAFVAAIVVFFWGFMSWAAIGIWDFAFPRATNESAITETLQSSLGGTGAYVVPSMPEGYGQPTEDPAKQAEFKAFEERMRAGPFTLILHRVEGGDVMEPTELVRGFGIEFVAALLLACVLSTVKGGFARKTFVGFTIALFAATACYGVMGNFMRMPLPFVMAFWTDAVIAWTLATVIIAKLTRN
ncbi:MAG: hypothetical protein RIS45_1538 [Planctomycetota bacterium]|jgi:hypothetical protein